MVCFDMNNWQYATGVWGICQLRNVTIPMVVSLLTVVVYILTVRSVNKEYMFTVIVSVCRLYIRDTIFYSVSLRYCSPADGYQSFFLV